MAQLVFNEEEQIVKERPHLMETSDYMEMLLYSCSISLLKYSFSSGLLAFKVGVSNPFCMENISLWMWMSLTCRESKKVS